MSTDITPFNFDGQAVRVVTIDGEPWFVASDVALVLDLGNMHSSLASLDDDERRLHSMETNAGARQNTVISESGVYSLVLRSRKPEAKTFKRWITREVLPQIRKHGAYATPATIEAMLSDPDTMIRILTDLKAERAQTAELTVQVEAAAPKVLFADAVATSDSTILVGDLAKILKANGFNTGAQRLFARLREEGFLIKRKGSDYNSPTQYSMELGLFRIKETAITHSDGHVTINKTPKVTGKGQQYFVNRYAPPATGTTRSIAS